MTNESLPDFSTIAHAVGNNAVDYGENGDDDGLGDFASEELCDSVYLHTDSAAEDEAAATVAAADLKISHSSGASKMKPDEFILRTNAHDFDAEKALAMIQHRYTMDYGRRSSGSRPASEKDEYYPVFYLDMISIVGSPQTSQQAVLIDKACTDTD